MSPQSPSPHPESSPSIPPFELESDQPVDPALEEPGPGSTSDAANVKPRRGRRKTRRTIRPEDAAGRPVFTARQRLLLLDTWMRSGLPGSEFSRLAGVSAHTPYEWRRRFELE